MIVFIIVLLLMNDFRATEEAKRAPNSLKGHKRKPFAALVFSNTYHVNTPSDKDPCDWLRSLKHQKKKCSKLRGLPDLLLQARELSIQHCQEQFRFDQWNCSRRDFFFKKFYRETAFMYSMASSAVMYQVAKACSQNALGGCHCGDHGKPFNSSEWSWGGCGDNSKFAKKFTKKFLQLRKKGDELSTIIKYNTEVGIKVVLQNEVVKCRCHGISGACSMKICWKHIRPFKDISNQLKNLYHKAIQVQQRNSIRSFKNVKSARKMLFLDNSPNLCNYTVNRHCNSTENCATLCCGRGSYEQTRQILNDECKCKWREGENYKVQCSKCWENQTIFRCK